MNNAGVVGSGFKNKFIVLKPAHIAGAKNVLADHPSRIQIKPLMVAEDKLFLKMIFQSGSSFWNISLLAETNAKHRYFAPRH